jgi:putative tryptophan/tyrosine transport system substrate-binding protein
MKRRGFLVLLGGAAVWPLAARAQHSKLRTIGYLHPDAGSLARDVTAFRLGLREAGYVERENLAIEFRFARGQPHRLAEFAAELVQKQIDAIFVPGGVAPVLAAKEATSSIPIVFANGSDPVRTGLVSSLNRPEGNVTGVTFVTGILQAKSLELLREVVPAADPIGVLTNPNTGTRELRLNEVEAASGVLGVRLKVAGAGTPDALEAAFSRLVEEPVGALLVVADPMFRANHRTIASLAIQHSIPVMTFARDFVEAGALMSYGTDIANSFREAGVYVGRILKGASPNDLPVLQPTKFELVINLKTARALGLEVPPTLLARANEVIE